MVVWKLSDIIHLPSRLTHNRLARRALPLDG
jgi:hypothetical protein